MPSYYDIDDALASDELVPCTTLFDFDNLAHLDPDYSHFQHRSNKGSTTVLPEGHRIKVPLWAVEKWATLGFVRVGLPGGRYGRKARERLAADPASSDLRMKSERYFLAGNSIVNLINRCSKVMDDIGSGRRGGNRGWRRDNVAAMKQVQKDATELRRTLLVTYTGERLRRTLDWTLNSMDDDVSGYTRRLTTSERRLFALGAEAARAHQEWKSYGSRRIAVSEAVLASRMYGAGAVPTSAGNTAANAVSPDNQEDGGEGAAAGAGSRKRLRSS